jgi:MoaA/NifB/PqqE/SkfB family radical SAM enzyme
VFKQLKALFAGAPPEPLGPTHCHVMTNISCQLNCHMCYGHSPTLKQNLWKKEQQLGTKDMDFDTFNYVLGFLPDVTHMTFSGWGDPLINPDLFKMIFLAHTKQKIRSMVVTNGLLLEARMDEILASPLHQLVISINGYSPQSYQKLTGMLPDVFSSVYRQIKFLIAQKRARNSLLPVWLSMIVDVDTVFEVPQMLHLAQELQVDGLQLVNYQSPDPKQPSPRTITASRTSLVNYFQDLSKEKHPFLLELPQVMPDGPIIGRDCSDPHKTIAVDGDCNVSACSMWYLFDGRMGKIWDPEFWHGEKIAWLRSVHSPKGKDDLPRPCQHCPKNCASRH